MFWVLILKEVLCLDGKATTPLVFIIHAFFRARLVLFYSDFLVFYQCIKYRYLISTLVPIIVYTIPEPAYSFIGLATHFFMYLYTHMYVIIGLLIWQSLLLSKYSILSPMHVSKHVSTNHLVILTHSQQIEQYNYSTLKLSFFSRIMLLRNSLAVSIAYIALRAADKKISL